jgi:hypothetical protein
MITIDDVENSRTRTDGWEPVYENCTKYYNGAVYQTISTLVNANDKTMTDVVVEKFFERLANGEIINNPCRLRQTTTVSGGGAYLGTKPGHVYVTSGGSLTQYQRSLSATGFVPTTNLISGDQVDDLIAQAKIECLAHIDETPYAFGEDVGEIKETLQFLRRPFSSLLKLGNTFERDVIKRMKLRRLSKRQLIVKGIRDKKWKTDNLSSKYGIARANAVADAWGEYSFAAAPLVRSIMDAAEAATWTNARVLPPRKTARGHTTLTQEGSEEYKHLWSGTVYDLYDRGWSHEVDVRAGCMYTVTNPVENLRWLLGLRTKDVPETIWQLMPMSFMLDRIVNVSKLIRGLTNLLDPQVRILTGWVVIRSDVERNIRFKSQINPGWDILVNGDTVREKDFSYERMIWTPEASDTIPLFKPKGLVKDINSIADLVSLTYRRWYGSLIK